MNAMSAPLFLALGKIGVPELLLILVIVLVIFGPKNLPKLSKTLGETITGFRKGMEEGMGKKSEDEAAADAKASESDSSTAKTEE